MHLFAPTATKRSRPMLDAYIYTGLRSPFGRHAGALPKMRPDDMLASIIAKVVGESGFGADKIEDGVLGWANQAGGDRVCILPHSPMGPRLALRITRPVVRR